VFDNADGTLEVVAVDSDWLTEYRAVQQTVSSPTSLGPFTPL
jgi:hypothetical protein